MFDETNQQNERPRRRPKVFVKRDRVRVCMTIFKDGGEQIINERELDFLRPDHREIIAKAAWWALLNGHTIQTEPLKDDDPKVEPFFMEV